MKDKNILISVGIIIYIVMSGVDFIDTDIEQQSDGIKYTPMRFER